MCIAFSTHLPFGSFISLFLNFLCYFQFCFKLLCCFLISIFRFPTFCCVVLLFFPYSAVTSNYFYKQTKKHLKIYENQQIVKWRKVVKISNNLIIMCNNILRSVYIRSYLLPLPILRPFSSNIYSKAGNGWGPKRASWEFWIGICLLIMT